jgi:hypothetical protein
MTLNVPLSVSIFLPFLWPLHFAMAIVPSLTHDY